ncbi:MAG: FAD-binding oxidoreductase [Alphaproteobacteria bacterium]|nr:FAD-binding oxidoreductase [Alphaproteobacteria bacterium]
MNAMAADVAVVGAGIVGLSSASFLRRAGVPVTVYDPLPPGGGASYGNGGLLSVEACIPISTPGMLRQVPRWLADPLGPLAVSPRHFPKALPWLLRWIRAGRMDRVLRSSDALRALHVPGLDQYRDLLGGDDFHDLIRTSGQVHVWTGERESRGELIARQLRERHGVVAEKLDPAELRQLVPGISPAIRRALFVPKNGYTVNPHRVVGRVGERFRAAGGTLRQERVMRILPADGGWRIVTNTGDRRHSRVVVAGGAWSKDLLAPLGVRIPLEAERGYHVTIRDPSVEVRIPVLHQSMGFGATPMEMGLRIGGTVEIAGLDIPMSPARAERMMALGRWLFPRLDGKEVSMWMGYRPGTPDSVPIIDAAPGHAGLYIACGHGHTGMTAGAVTGKLVAQLVQGEPTMVDLQHFRIARFG